MLSSLSIDIASDKQTRAICLKEYLQTCTLDQHLLWVDANAFI